MTYIAKQLNKGLSPLQACAKLLKQIGPYAFNKWCVKQGIRLEFCLMAHREAKKA